MLRPWSWVQMRRFERVGMSRRQAEQLTQVVTEVLCTNREKLADSYVSKGVLERVSFGAALVAQGCAVKASSSAVACNAGAGEAGVDLSFQSRKLSSKQSGSKRSRG